MEICLFIPESNRDLDRKWLYWQRSNETTSLMLLCHMLYAGSILVILKNLKKIKSESHQAFTKSKEHTRLVQLTEDI